MRNVGKTRLLAFGKHQAWHALHQRQRLPTVDYLGFTHYWGRSRTGRVRVKRKTSKKRFRRALADLHQWLRQEHSARNRVIAS
jgi:RNA-directed DNA polymerase